MDQQILLTEFGDKSKEMNQQNLLVYEVLMNQQKFKQIQKLNEKWKKEFLNTNQR